MDKKKVIILSSIVILGIVGFVIYRIVTDYSLTIKLSQNEIKVNLYDTIDIRSYLIDSYDNKGKNFIDSVKITAEYDSVDELNGDLLYIGGNGSKVVYYSVENNDIVTTETLVINVITDPNDPDFNPNYSANKSGINTQDTGDDSPGGNLTDEQIKYLDRYRSK